MPLVARRWPSWACGVSKRTLFAESVILFRQSWPRTATILSMPNVFLAIPSRPLKLVLVFLRFSGGFLFNPLQVKLSADDLRTAQCSHIVGSVACIHLSQGSRNTLLHPSVGGGKHMTYIRAVHLCIVACTNASNASYRTKYMNKFLGPRCDQIMFRPICACSPSIFTKDPEGSFPKRGSSKCDWVLGFHAALNGTWWVPC